MVGFDGANTLDVVGPLEAFANAGRADPTSRRSAGAYRTCILGLTDAPFVTEAGIRITPDCTLGSAPRLDTIIVPGGWGVREPHTNATLAGWLREHAPDIRRVVSVCTGAYALAEAGLLDGRRAATHWRFAAEIARRYPRVSVDGDAIFVKDGRYYTSGGITAGIDLALALIEEDMGAQAALTVARELVMYLKRPGGQAQYSEPLRAQSRAPDGYAELVAWIAGHPAADLSVEALAGRVGLSPRHFARRFSAAFGTSPAAYVEGLRLAEARERLMQPAQSVERVARQVGYRSTDVFRRRFERRFGITPASYRARFATTRSAHVDSFGQTGVQP